MVTWFVASKRHRRNFADEAEALKEAALVAAKLSAGDAQFLKRRKQFPLGTPIKAAAAAKARDIYLSLQASGWEATFVRYKAKPEEPKPENSMVGDLIRAVAETASYRNSTFAVY